MNADNFLSNIETSLKDNWDLAALTDFKGECYGKYIQRNLEKHLKKV